MTKKYIVSGVGCCLVDRLFTGINFRGKVIEPFLSKARGDGGLVPGQLVFKEEFEKYCGVPLEHAINQITGGRNQDKVNIGGPGIVSLINLAQLVGSENCEIRFLGRCGKDIHGDYLISKLSETPVVLADYKIIDNQTPSTIVLSDSDYDNGHGERIFINSIGASWNYSPLDIKMDFFNSDIVAFGGTALTPAIHDDLTELLKRAKKNGCKTIVNTVFDFRNDNLHQSKQWPLGESEESYKYIDLLIADKGEALSLSGKYDIKSSIKYFSEAGVSSVVVTDGANNIQAFSDGRMFLKADFIEMPVSDKIKNELKIENKGDTTGCGDNFAGGVMASLVMQLTKGINNPDLIEACSWGIVSGGFACFYLGGTFFEKTPGEKFSRLKNYYNAYHEQYRDQK